jgi:hypothetical protein
MTCRSRISYVALRTPREPAGSGEKLSRSNLTRARWTGDSHRRAQRNQRRGQTGRVHEVGGPVVAKNGVILIFSAGYQRFTAGVLREQAEAITEIPAAGTLAEIAGDRSHRSHLRAGDTGRGLRQRGIVPGDGAMGAQLLDRNQRAEGHTLLDRADALQLAYAFHVDQTLGLLDVILQQREQIGAAGEHGCVTPAWA